MTTKTSSSPHSELKVAIKLATARSLATVRKVGQGAARQSKKLQFFRRLLNALTRKQERSRYGLASIPSAIPPFHYLRLRF